MPFEAGPTASALEQRRSRKRSAKLRYASDLSYRGNLQETRTPMRAAKLRHAKRSVILRQLTGDENMQRPAIVGQEPAPTKHCSTPPAPTKHCSTPKCAQMIHMAQRGGAYLTSGQECAEMIHVAQGAVPTEHHGK